MKPRHLLLAAGLAIALWLALQETPAPVAVVGASAKPSVSRAVEKPSLSLTTERSAIAQEARANLFGSAHWLATPKPITPALKAAPIKPITLVSTAPVLPNLTPPEPVPTFRFIGMFQDLRSTKPSVFLAQGERLIVAAAGDKLEGGFTLESISATELILQHPAATKPLRIALQGAPL
jgi:hypothetical protein